MSTLTPERATRAPRPEQLRLRGEPEHVAEILRRVWARIVAARQGRAA